MYIFAIVLLLGIVLRRLRLEYGPRSVASGRTQDLWHSFSQHGPPGRQITYIYLVIVKRANDLRLPTLCGRSMTSCSD